MVARTNGLMTTCPVVEVRVVEPMDLLTVPALRERLMDALGLAPEHLVVDLSRCSFFDATGINMLLEVHRQAWRQSTRLVLHGCSQQHLRILALMGLLDVFDRGESERV